MPKIQLHDSNLPVGTELYRVTNVAEITVHTITKLRKSGANDVDYPTKSTKDAYFYTDIEEALDYINQSRMHKVDRFEERLKGRDDLEITFDTDGFIKKIVGDLMFAPQVPLYVQALTTALVPFTIVSRWDDYFDKLALRVYRDSANERVRIKTLRTNTLNVSYIRQIRFFKCIESARS